MRLGEILRKRRKELKLTLQDVALEIGTDPANLSRMERGEQGIDETKMNALLRALKLQHTFSPTLTAAQPEGPRYEVMPVPQPTVAHVPIVGTTTGGTGGFWDELGYPAGHGDGYLDAPSNDPGAYALRVKGSSMSPRIYEGEIILIEPNRQCHPGDEVVVRTVDGQIMVKLLLTRRGGQITLGSVANGDRLVFDEQQIQAMHFVAGVFRAGAVKDA